MMTDCVSDRLPLASRTNTRSPGTSNVCILRHDVDLVVTRVGARVRGHHQAVLRHDPEAISHVCVDPLRGERPGAAILAKRCASSTCLTFNRRLTQTASAEYVPGEPARPQTYAPRRMLIKLGFELVFDIPATPVPMVLMLYTHPEQAHVLQQPEAIYVEPDVPLDQLHRPLRQPRRPHRRPAGQAAAHLRQRRPRQRRAGAVDRGPDAPPRRRAAARRASSSCSPAGTARSTA